MFSSDDSRDAGTSAGQVSDDGGYDALGRSLGAAKAPDVANKKPSGAR